MNANSSSPSIGKDTILDSSDIPTFGTVYFFYGNDLKDDKLFISLNNSRSGENIF